MPITRGKIDGAGKPAKIVKMKAKAMKDSKGIVANVNKWEGSRSKGKETNAQIGTPSKLKAKGNQKNKEVQSKGNKPLGKSVSVLEEQNSDGTEMTAYERLAQKVKNAKRQWEEAICEDEAPPDKTKKLIGIDEEYPTSQRRGTAIVANYMEDDRLMTFDVDAEDSFCNSEEDSGSEQD